VRVGPLAAAFAASDMADSSIVSDTECSRLQAKEIRTREAKEGVKGAAKEGHHGGQKYIRRRPTILGRSLVFAESSERPYGKEFVAAGDTTVGRKPQCSAEKRCLTRNMLCRDALQFKVAADSAVGVQQIPKGSVAPAKPRLTRFTPPRKDAADAQEIVKD